MERDIWLEHMESRCGCDDDGFDAEEFDGNKDGGVPCEGSGERLLAESPSPIRMTACEWMRSNPTIPTERPEVMDEDKFRAKFNLAPRRL